MSFTGVQEITDAELVALAQAGDEGAFPELHRRYERKLQTFCRSLMKGGESDDVAQEAFIRAWRSIDSCKDDCRFYPWLRTIAKNLAYDLMRHNHPSVSVGDIETLPSSSNWCSIEDVETANDAIDQAPLLGRAMSNVSSRHRSLIELRLSGSSYADIASSEGVAESAVKSTLWRARHALERELVSYVDQMKTKQVSPRPDSSTERRRHPSRSSSNPDEPVRIDTTRLWELEGKGWADVRQAVTSIRHSRRENPTLVTTLRQTDVNDLAFAFGISVERTLGYLKVKKVSVDSKE